MLNLNWKIGSISKSSTTARISFQAGSKNNGSCATIKQNITTARIQSWETLEPKIWRLESCGSLTITVSAEAVCHLTQNKSDPLLQFAVCSW